MVNGYSKYFALAILLLCGQVAFAQYQVKATALTHDIKDLSQRDSKIVDQNGEKCALIKFETPIPKLFSFNLGAQQIEAREDKDDEVWIWVSADVKKMTIRCTDCTALKDYRVTLKGGNTYRAKLTTGLPQETSTHQNINIYCEQTPYSISIDDAEPVLSTQKNYYAELPVGVHDLTITARYYKPYSASFRLLRSKAYTDTIKLMDNFGDIIVSCSQPDYTIALDEEQQAGRGVIRVEPGKHKVEVMKERYESYVTEVDVKLYEKKYVSAMLKPAFALFTITTSDDETEIWIDGQNRGRNRVVAELLWGEHTIEGRREGFDTWEYPIHDFNVNSEKTIKIPKLTQQFGTVRLTVFPPGSRVFVDGQQVELVGANYINKLTVGLHHLQIRMTDYRTERDTFTVQAGKLFAQEYALEHIPLGEITIKTDPNIGIYRLQDGKDPLFLGRESFHGKLPAGEVIIELKDTKFGMTCQHRLFINEAVVNPPQRLPFERKLLVRTNVVGGSMLLKSDKENIWTRPNKQMKLYPNVYERIISKRGYQVYTDTLDLTQPYARDMVLRTHLFKKTDTLCVHQPKPRYINPIFKEFYDRQGTWYAGLVNFGYTFGIVDFSHMLTFGVASLRYKLVQANLADFELCMADSAAVESRPSDFTYRSLSWTPRISLVVPCAKKFAMTFFGGFSVNIYDNMKKVEGAHRDYFLVGSSMQFNNARHCPINLFAEYRWPLAADYQPTEHKEKLFRVGAKFTIGLDY